MKKNAWIFAVMMLTSFPSPSVAQNPAPAKTDTKSAPKPLSNATPFTSPTGVRVTSEAVRAAQAGDVPAMNRLRGIGVTLQGKPLRTYRKTKSYRDILVLTGPDFHLAGTQSGIELLVRIPNTFKADKLPNLIDVTGTLTDFESRPEQEVGVEDRLLWMPVITAEILK